MKVNPLGAGFRPALFAVALCSAAIVQAASGFIITTAQQSAIQVGMSRDEVRSLLGDPARNDNYGNEPGRTWTYGIDDHSNTGYEIVFDIQFSADGRVESKGQRAEVVF